MEVEVFAFPRAKGRRYRRSRGPGPGAVSGIHFSYVLTRGRRGTTWVKFPALNLSVKWDEGIWEAGGQGLNLCHAV